MSVDSALPWLISVALLTVRLTVAVALSPSLSSFGVPAPVRVALTFALAALTFAYRSPVQDAAAWVANPGLLVPAVLGELLIGAVLGFGVHVVMAALAVAGRLLDVQIGFAIASTYDPVSRTSSNVLGSLMSLAGVTLLMVGGAQVQLAQWVAQSLDFFPLGKFPSLGDPGALLRAAGTMFSLGLALAAPVSIALLLTDVAIGVISRNMPQINVLVLAMPVKVLVGYGTLALVLRGWGLLLEQGLGTVTRTLEPG